MTHLKIEQNNGITEQVSPSVIEKLYEIVHSGNLDSSSNLVGSLNTTGTYLDYVDYLEELFTKNGIRLLIITANKLYISFADPEILSGLATEYGDGTGVTLTNMSGITRLKDSLFRDNTSVLSFNELGQFSNITTIGSDTFYGCSNLTSIDLSNIEYIGRYAFYEANLTGAINLPSFRNFIDPTYYYGWRSYAFGGNSAITSVTFGENYTGILEQGGIFLGCTNLTTILGLKTNLDNHTMPMNMFSGCRSLTSIGNIDLSHYTKFDDGCFDGCSSLTGMNINPSVITRVGDGSFRNANIGEGQTLELNLTDLEYYPNNAFAGTKYSRLILHCPLLKGTCDGRYPFYENMQQLTYLDLSDWLVSKASWDNSKYADCSFYSNIALVTYIAPINTNYIGTIIGGLGNYSNFRYLILLSTTPPALNTTDSNNPPSYWFYNKGGHVDIYVPDSAKAAYLADTNWASIGGIDGSDTIVDRLHGLSELPNGVWTTGLAASKYHFFNDPEVTRTLTLAYAVEDGVALTNSDISTITSIPANTFKNNTSLLDFSDLNTINNCTTIGEEAFYGCTSLTSIDLSNITHIGNNAFYGCSNLGLNLDLDITLDEYRSGMFYGTGYRSVTLHCNQAYTYNITGNSSSPFSNMSNLLKLDFSDTKMDVMRLINSSNVTTLILPTTMTIIEWNTFSGFNEILYIVILANNVVSLESADYMLHGSYHPNANVYVPDSLVSLYQSATNWSNISTRIKGISELPSSVTWYTQTS